MWINDVERESTGLDVKSIECAIHFVVGGGAVTESEGTTVSNICHPTILWGKKKEEERRGEREEEERNSNGGGKEEKKRERQSRQSVCIVIGIRLRTSSRGNSR